MGLVRNTICCVCLQRESDRLADLMMKVFREGLEGLVLKDLNVSRLLVVSYSLVAGYLMLLLNAI